MQTNNENYSNDSITNLLDIVAYLRDPENGCPWDKIQTHDSLIPFVLEEAHEVADAIRQGCANELKEELGDLLLQIVLHAQIASEEKQFCLSDIARGISQKLIRRHPHVFQNKVVKNLEELNKNWEEIKSQEKPLEKSSSPISTSLKAKVRSQSAINGATIISNKIAKTNFAWPNIESIWEKFNEEVDEFKEALIYKKTSDAQEELGDLIFTLVNIARWYKLSPEEGIASANTKFLERFSFLEESLNGKLNTKNLTQLKKTWNKSKENLSNEITY